MVDGKINALSVSQLQDAGACERSWYLAKVVRAPKPQTKALSLGSKLDEQWGHWLTTGEDVLGELARLAKDLLPVPGPDLLVKRKFGGELLSADGIPLNGEFDLVNPRRLASEGIVRVTDNKTSADPAKYAPTAEQLRRIDLAALRRDEKGAASGIQMVGYAVAVAKLFPDANLIELEHVYTPTKAPKSRAKSFPVSTWITPDDARERWHSNMDPLARRLKTVAQAPGLDDVEPNWKACDRYGGCPFKTICITHRTGETAVSLREKLKQQQSSTTTPPPAAAPEQQSTTPPPAPAAAMNVGFQHEPEPEATIIPPDAPASKPELAAQQPAPEPEAKPKRTRAKTEVLVAPAPEPVRFLDFEIFVDCMPTAPSKSLNAYVAPLVEKIREKFEVLDVRCAPHADHPLAFGKWKGILAAMIRETPPAPGLYVAAGVKHNDALAEAVQVLDAHVIARGV